MHDGPPGRADVVQAGDKHHTGGGDPSVRSALLAHLDAATAYAHRRQNFLLSAMSPSQQALDAVWDAEMLPHADGLHLSFDTDTRPERLTDAFPEPTLTRLRTVKRDWDPENLFRANFPVPPAE
ncbi:BBE domain-containing protein [Isoptericola halotolerans]|uniref:BBE domain-containing protein n=1 Tax=Isoptericola halotolerans TaxID=300560 RepID=UPI00388E3FCB